MFGVTTKFQESVNIFDAEAVLISYLKLPITKQNILKQLTLFSLTLGHEMYNR